MRFIDTSPFPAMCFRHRNARGELRWVAVMRVSCDIGRYGGLALSAPPSPVGFRESSFGDIVTSAPRAESDLAPEKPRTDVIVHANAYAPGGRPSARFEVSLAVREADRASRRPGRALCERRLVVTGPRVWSYVGRDWELSDAVPVTDVPLRFEYAYGGTVRLDDDPQAPHEPPLVLAHSENPVGRGFVPEAAAIAERFGLGASDAAAARAYWCARQRRIPAPQIELPGQPLRSVREPYPLAGWGLVAKHWHTRYRHAGTYDAAWMAERHPLLPLDFDPLYWNGAHPDLQLERLPEDGVIELQGLAPVERSADQRLEIALPGLRPRAEWRDVRRPTAELAPLRLDTVVVDLLEDRLVLLYRLNLPDSPSLAYIHVGMEEVGAPVPPEEATP